LSGYGNRHKTGVRLYLLGAACVYAAEPPMPDIPPELVEQIAAAVAAKMGGGASQGPPMAYLLERWADAHRQLKSFDCDYKRGLFVLAWAPTEGPYAAVPLDERPAMSLSPVDVDLYRA